MNFRTLLAAVAFFGITASAALAQNAYSTGNVNMRAGPGTQYPRVTTVPRGSGVDVHGCISGWSWCDTSWRGARGWVSGNYLQMMYNNRRVYVPEYGPRIGIPTITFQFGNYWDRWYRDRPWYRERNRWDDRRPGRWQDQPPRPRPPVAVRPVPPKPGIPPQVIRPRPPRPDMNQPRPPQIDRPRPPRPGEMGNQRPPRPGNVENQRPRPPRGEPNRPRPGEMRGERRGGRQGNN